MRPGGMVLRLGATAALLASTAPPASAHHDEVPGLVAPDELSALGYEHAADHANRPAPAAFPRDELSAPNAFTGGAPDEVGRWARAYFPLPSYAIHTVMLPTGKVLFWGPLPALPEGQLPRPNGAEAALWDPLLGTGPRSITRVDPPLVDPDGPGPLAEITAPLFCSGQTVLPSGAVLAVGGNLLWPDDDQDDAYEYFAGADIVYTFDPYAERWIAQARMERGRWYPSVLRLADGRAAILGGLSERAPGLITSDLLELYTPGPGPSAQGSLATVGRGEALLTGLYPHLTQLPNGRVLLSGPHHDDYALIDFPAPGSGAPAAIEELPEAPDLADRIGGNVVPLGPTPQGAWQVTQIGGLDLRFPANPDDPPERFRFPAHPTTTTTDGRSGQTSEAAPLPSARSFGNTVLLPDGSMVQVGGGDGNSPDAMNWEAVEVDKRVQLFDPGSGTWRLGPSQREFRTYHSTAVLLPDGRVFSAGDDYHPVESDGYAVADPTDTAEIYKPPYLFREGRRPRIADAPHRIGHGERFAVITEGGRGERAVLMAPSATTHGADMGQARIPLRRLPGGEDEGLRLMAPPRPEVASPGPYMLFVLSAARKPSVARWVFLR